MRVFLKLLIPDKILSYLQMLIINIIERSGWAQILRNLRRWVLMWWQIHRWNQQNRPNQMEWTQHPFHWWFRSFQTPQHQFRSFVPVEDSNSCSSKSTSMEDFRGLFYCKIHYNHGHSSCLFSRFWFSWGFPYFIVYKF